MRTRTLFSMIVLASAACGRAQTARSMGTVSTQDATVDGTPGVQAVGDRLTLAGSTTVVAKAGRNATVTLARGGTILVCQTSPLHLAGAPDALAIGLDRGALEIHARGMATDAILTPDLRITLPGGGPLDLRLRVSPNGDTCVENRGKKAPTLALTDAFGETSYQLKPGQHVLFEGGSLRAVVDRETTPCGCPPEDTHAVPLAEAILHGGTSTPQQAAAANPFPTAQSEGLAAPPPLPADKPGETALSYQCSQKRRLRLTRICAREVPAPPVKTAPSANEAYLVPSHRRSPPGGPGWDIAHAIGRVLSSASFIATHRRSEAMAGTRGKLQSGSRAARAAELSLGESHTFTQQFRSSPWRFPPRRCVPA